MKQARIRPTSHDVAERAGVSQSTVSRALAGSTVISALTRARVEEAARELNYSVHEGASNLRSGNLHTIAVVLIARAEDPIDRLNPVASTVLASVLRAGRMRGLDTLVSYQADEEELSGTFIDRGLAGGIIVIGTTANLPAWDYFRAIDNGTRPVAYWGGASDDLAFVRPDNVEGARLATRHLLEKGYGKPVFLGSATSGQVQFRERLAGFNLELESRGQVGFGIELSENLSREEQGRDAIARLIQQGRAFDAVFAPCDACALGAMAELRSRNIAVPDEVGIIGFDGIASGGSANPSLTTIRPDFEAAGEALIDMLQGSGGKATRIPVALLERDSTSRR